MARQACVKSCASDDSWRQAAGRRRAKRSARAGTAGRRHGPRSPSFEGAPSEGLGPSAGLLLVEWWSSRDAATGGSTKVEGCRPAAAFARRRLTG